jgi:phenylalanyl-tRNA synthetase beta chain
MKVSLDWLRTWVDVPLSAADLGARLTMAGFELESLAPAAPAFSGVVVAEILDAVRHPQADKLQVCKVTTGSGEPLQIVCGASNARPGLRTALARVGALLPGDVAIKAAKLRGVESAGMLCSAKELGLGDAGPAGILELPADAPLGVDLRVVLGLDDVVLELAITPNRGDAMSMLGIAREVAALTSVPLRGPAFEAVPAQSGDTLAVHLSAPEGCARFLGRVIRGLDNTRTTPLWLRERLRRAGLRSISPVVDVTNYVLLELGQPMHAYDAAKLQGSIDVRWASAGEPCELLDGRSVALAPDMLVIADGGGPVGVAGVMGGARTAVSATTTDVFLEVAWFAPAALAGRARRLGLATDASQRFERGVDPAGQERALQRATQLLLDICGGSPGPAELVESQAHLPRRRAVDLRRDALQHTLGVALDDGRVVAALTALGMPPRANTTGFSVTAPSHRFDIALECDLVEEVARIVGYDAIPEIAPRPAQHFRPAPEKLATEQGVLGLFAARGWHESISFAFVEPAEQQRLLPGVPAAQLENPISAELAQMRVSLWPGLLRVLGENLRRQQDRVRLVERGTVFLPGGSGVPGAVEKLRLAGAACGRRLPEQWGTGADSVDFHDVKADLEAAFAATGRPAAFEFSAEPHAALHPGRSARVQRDGRPVGWLGELHPKLVRALDLTYAPILFELDWEETFDLEIPEFREISRFPQVRRDLAITLDESVPFSAIRERVTFAAGGLLKALRVFDIYRGAGVEPGRKSVALGLIFQEISRTLTDEETDRLMAVIRAEVSASLKARIRE